jgi:hypothetical protein
MGETKDVSARHPQIAARLRALFEAWDKRNIAPIFLNPQEIRQQQWSPQVSDNGKPEVSISGK